MSNRVVPSLYTEPPSFDIELDDFLDLPLRRLEVFRLLRSAGKATGEGATSSHKDSGDAAVSLFLEGDNEQVTADLLRGDLAGHFILRLACCGRAGGGVSHRGHLGLGEIQHVEESEETLRDRREWFVRVEKELFECRLKRYLLGRDGAGRETSRDESASPLEALHREYGLRWLRPLGDDRRERRRTSNSCRYRGIGNDTVTAQAKGCAGTDVDLLERRVLGDGAEVAPIPHRNDSELPPTAAVTRPGKRKNPSMEHATRSFWQMSCPFERVLPLVRSRQVGLRGGQAVLALWQVPVAVVLHFERLLREGLAVSERALPGLEEDERVRDSLEEVRRAVASFVGSEGSESRHTKAEAYRSAVDITCSNIDQIAEVHFPLCMRRTLRVLRREHHLKYQARLQLVSFLANAGMEVGEVLKLWRAEFPKGMKPGEYARKRNSYEYSVRHLFGLEGKRKIYTPLSCRRIAGAGWGSGSGGLGHGCPFKSASLDRGRARVPTHGHPPVPGACGAFGAEGGLDEDTLPGILASQGLSQGDIEDIVGPMRVGRADGSRIEGNSYRYRAALGACRRHFTVSSKARGRAGAVGDGSESWRNWGGAEQSSSPNMWLAASTRLTIGTFLTQDES